MSMKNRKQRGSVLLTVIFVMSILIVFLFGTIALAMAANNRAHVNYSSAQTGITARAVAQSAIKAIGNTTEEGKAYAKAIGKMEPGNKLSVGVDLSGSNAGTMGHVDDVEISYAGTKKYYDIIKEEWLERDVLKFTATVNMSGVQSSSSIYVIKHYEEDTEGGGSGGAGFVTTAGAGLTCQSNLWGGSYISLPSLSVAQGYDYTNEHIDRGFGDSTKEENRFLLKEAGATLEADLYVNNNMYIQNWRGVVFPSAGTGITVMGDLCFDNNAAGNLRYIYNGKKDNLNFNEVPYIYVDGHLYTDGDGKLALGNSSADPKLIFPLNTFCGWMTIKGNNASSNKISSNIYCMDSNMTSEITPMNPGGNTGLYMWTESVVTQVKTGPDKNVINGELCSNGNLKIKDFEVNSDIRVRGNLEVEGTVTVHGNVVVGGTITGAENLKLDPGKEIYNLGLSSTEIVHETITVDNEKGYYFNYDPFTHTNGEGKYVDPKGDMYVNGAFDWQGNFNPGAWVNGHQLGNSHEGLTIYYTLENGYEPTVEDLMNDTIKDHIDYSKDPIYSVATEQLNLAEGSTNMFYYETTPKEGTIVKLDTAPYYDYVREVHYNRKTSSPTTDYDYVYSYEKTGLDPQVYLNSIGESTVYPEYALRTVVVGKEKIRDLDKNKTKVINTLEEVLTNVANPYDSSTLPAGMLTVYNKLINADGSLTADGQAVYYTSEQMASEKNGNKYVRVNSISDDGSYTVETGAWDQNNDIAYISDSCILDFELGSQSGKGIVFNPGNKDILVVVRNLKFSSGNLLFIDDSQGGNVYFYIDKNSYMGGFQCDIITKTYWKAIKANTQFKYNSTNTTENSGYFDIATLGPPHCYIYGGEGSEYSLSQVGFTTANILSPYISGHLSAGGNGAVLKDGHTINNFEYNNIDVMHVKDNAGTQITTGSAVFIIGCFNVQNVTVDNGINIIYIADDGGKKGHGEAGDDEFWYKSLYYSEF